MAVKRVNLGIFGRVNAGKSSLMNLILNQEFSIVDSTPGTTADTKISILQIHDFSPVKIYDTAGIDEISELGKKKKEKTFTALKNSDIILLVINPNNSCYEKDDFSSENEIIELSKKYNKTLLLIYNKINNKNLDKKIEKIEKKINNKKEFKFLSINIIDNSLHSLLINFIKTNFKIEDNEIKLVPILKKNSIVFLNIPMDEETPEKRLLRPQLMVEEFLIRNFIQTFSYRMDLKKARSKNKLFLNEEKNRFEHFINLLNSKNDLSLIITDSQAIDVISKWNKNIPVTTYSIIMINYLSNGNLKTFIDGVKILDNLKKGDKILILEACNHDRKNEDIGTKQIPDKIEEMYGKNNIIIDHSFGRVFPNEEKLKEYKLLIHCGGCMIDSQMIMSRLKTLIDLNLNITNYGIFLSYFQGKEVLKRVIKPFGIEI
jgi:[FeFe] hydrogenase H-cluster maturation GTPase HydF